MASADLTTDEIFATLESDGTASYFKHTGTGTIVVTNVGSAPTVIGSEKPRHRGASYRVGEYLLAPGMSIRMPKGRRLFYHQAGEQSTILAVAVE